jgi:hypothetical protein
MIHSRLIKIGDRFLTDDNTENGVRYISSVRGLENLEDAFAGAITKAADGFPYKFLVENTGQGVPIRIELRGLYSADRAALRTLMNAAETAREPVRVIFSDGPDDCDVDCLLGTPEHPRPMDFSGEFSTDLSFEAVIHLTVRGRHA